MLLSEKSLTFVGLLLLFQLMFILEIVKFGKWSLVSEIRIPLVLSIKSLVNMLSINVSLLSFIRVGLSINGHNE